MFSSQESKVDGLIRYFVSRPRGEWCSVRELADVIGCKNKYRVHKALRELVDRGFLVERTVETNLINGQQFFYHTSERWDTWLS